MINLPGFEEAFTGRTEALSDFSSLLTKHRQQNAIYFYGPGGIGKSWLFAKIRSNWHDPPRRIVTKVLDFYDSKNKSVQGLMESIINELCNFGDYSLFQAYFDARAEYKRLVQGEGQPSGLIDVAKKKLETQFLNVCNDFAHGKYFILLFDTFEVAQFRDAGRWFLSYLVPNLYNFTIVFAGRPPEIFSNHDAEYAEYLDVNLPGNVMCHRLTGFNSTEVVSYYELRNMLYPQDVLEKFNRIIQGRPLIHYLTIRYLETIDEDDRVSSLKKLISLGNLERIEDQVIGWVLEDLPKRNINAYQILMAMALFWRRFDREMLDYMLRQHRSDIFPYDDPAKTTEQFASEIIGLLEHYQFVKSRPELSNGFGSYLLHDEMLRIGRRMFKLAAFTHVFKDRLYGTILQKFYNEKIEQFEREGKDDFRIQYVAEQFGYLLESNQSEGMKSYWVLVNQARDTNDYALEELLWAEVQNSLGEIVTDDEKAFGYEVAQKRGDWLFATLQYEKAIHQYEDLINLFPERNILFNYGRLGHSYFRTGNHEKALIVYSQGVEKAKQKNSLGEEIAFGIHIAVLKQKTGDWEGAVSDLENATDASLNLIGLNSEIGKTLYARANYYAANILALQGKYVPAEERCIESINILEKFSPSSDLLNAYHYMGVIFRYQKNLSRSVEYLEKAIDLSKNSNIGFSITTLLDLGVVHLEEAHQYRLVKDNAQALSALRQAFDYIKEGLLLAREKGLDQEKAAAFGRLGRVYSEYDDLEQDLGIDLQLFDMQELTIKMKDLVLLEEEKWIYSQKSVGLVRFQELDQKSRAERLLELSYLEADAINDTHRALQSLMELTQLEVRRKDYIKTQKFIEDMEDFRGDSKEHEELFYLVADIARGSLSLSHMNDQNAALFWSRSYLRLSKKGGYALILLNDAILNLKNSLSRIEPKRSLFIIQEMIRIISQEDTSNDQLISRLLNYQREYTRILKEHQIRESK